MNIKAIIAPEEGLDQKERWVENESWSKAKKAKHD